MFFRPKRRKFSLIFIALSVLIISCGFTFISVPIATISWQFSPFKSHKNSHIRRYQSETLAKYFVLESEPTVIKSASVAVVIPVPMYGPNNQLWHLRETWCRLSNMKEINLNIEANEGKHDRKSNGKRKIILPPLYPHYLTAKRLRVSQRNYDKVNSLTLATEDILQLDSINAKMENIELDMMNVMNVANIATVTVDDPVQVLFLGAEEHAHSQYMRKLVYWMLHHELYNNSTQSNMVKGDNGKMNWWTRLVDGLSEWMNEGTSSLIHVKILECYKVDHDHENQRLDGYHVVLSACFNQWARYHPHNDSGTTLVQSSVPNEKDHHDNEINQHQDYFVDNGVEVYCPADYWNRVKWRTRLDTRRLLLDNQQRVACEWQLADQMMGKNVMIADSDVENDGLACVHLDEQWSAERWMNVLDETLAVQVRAVDGHVLESVVEAEYQRDNGTAFGVVNISEDGGRMMVRVGSGKPGFAEQWMSVRELAKILLRLCRQTGKKSRYLFITTNLGGPVLTALRLQLIKLAARGGGERLLGISTVHDNDVKQEKEGEDDDSANHDADPSDNPLRGMLEEQAVCVHARYYIGVSGSTFTENVLIWREQYGRSAERLYLL